MKTDCDLLKHLYYCFVKLRRETLIRNYGYIGNENFPRYFWKNVMYERFWANMNSY